LQHTTDCDVEVRVAGWQPQIFAAQSCRHRHVIISTERIPFHGSQPRRFFPERGVVRVVTIYFHDRHNRSLTDKARQVSTVTISIIAFNPSPNQRIS